MAHIILAFFGASKKKKKSLFLGPCSKLICRNTRKLESPILEVLSKYFRHSLSDLSYLYPTLCLSTPG